MKYILQIPAHLYIGGVEKVSRDIGMYADHNKYEVHYIIFDKDIGEYGRELVKNGHKIFCLREPSENYIQFFRELNRIMTETQYDIIHVHTMFNIGWSMLVAKHKKVPIRIAHAHSALGSEYTFLKYIYEVIMRKIILHDATDLIACGEKAGIRLFGRKAYETRCNLILNGISVDRFKYSIENRQKIRKKYDLEDKLVIGHVGHLEKVKNQEFLLNLLPKIKKINPNVKLLMLGEGSDRKFLEDKISKLGLSEDVIMTGNVPNVYEYLSAMDVLAFPSLYEGMPLSIVEAQANGLPCVISNGVPKDVHLTDLIHALPLENSENEWIHKICTLQRNETIDYAKQLKDAGFDVEGVMNKFYEIYSKADRK